MYNNATLKDIDNVDSAPISHLAICIPATGQQNPSLGTISGDHPFTNKHKFVKVKICLSIISFPNSWLNTEKVWYIKLHYLSSQFFHIIWIYVSVAS